MWLRAGIILLIMSCSPADKPMPRRSADTPQRTPPGEESSAPDPNDDTGTIDPLPDDTGTIDPLPDDSGGPDDTGSDPTPPPPPRICTSDWLTAPPVLPPLYTHSLGMNYRIVEIETDAFETFHLTVFFPTPAQPSAYADGAPVVVTSMPSLGIGRDWEIEPKAYFEPEMGVIEVQPVHPGWRHLDYMTSGTHDGAGPFTALSLREAALFAAGVRTTVDGLTLGQLVGRDVCNNAVVLLGSSGGGVTALTALNDHPDHLSDRLLGYAGYENPSLPIFMVQDTGALWLDQDESVDADGNGYSWDDGRNVAYVDDSCAEWTCTIDYATIDWSAKYSAADLGPAFYSSGKAGLLFLDRNSDGKLNVRPDGHTDVNEDGFIGVEEDYPILPHQDNYSGNDERHYYSLEALSAAVDAGVLVEGEMPLQIAPISETAAFWTERNLVVQIPRVIADLPPWFKVTVVFTEIDHGVAIGRRPHITQVYDAWQEAGVHVRYNLEPDAVDCLLHPDLVTGWGGGSEASAVISADDIAIYAIPEVVPAPHARAAGALNVFWESWGPFDHCPHGDR